MITCGYWEVVDEVEPIVLYSNLGCYYVMLILLCYARRRGSVLREFIKDVRVIVN